MFNYEICVKGLETYTIREADSEEVAISQAVDYCQLLGIEIPSL